VPGSRLMSLEGRDGGGGGGGELLPSRAYSPEDINRSNKDLGGSGVDRGGEARGEGEDNPLTRRPRTRHGPGMGGAKIAKSLDLSGHLQFGVGGLEARGPMPLLQRRDRRCGDLPLSELK